MLDEALLRDFRQEWFGIREDALALMVRYDGQNQRPLHENGSSIDFLQVSR